MKAALPLAADNPGVILSKHVNKDFELTADPSAKVWQDTTPVYAEKGFKGDLEPEYRTTIRSRWSDGNLYFLYASPYKTLYLKPNPTTTEETNKLWDWDVVEAFIGTDFEHIKRYKEFEVSPQGEWVDLDINLDHSEPVGGIKWDSGFASKTRIDADKKIWYCEMRIPMDKIDSRKAQAGNEMRVNLYRIEGGPPNRVHIAWQPTGRPSYHTPEAFGLLKLVK
jgi:hypothetical protein